MPVAEMFRQAAPFAAMLGHIQQGVEQPQIGQAIGAEFGKYSSTYSQNGNLVADSFSSKRFERKVSVTKISPTICGKVSRILNWPLAVVSPM